MVRRAVKYCGGCNPRYDRTALVRCLEEKLDAVLLPAEAGNSYDELYVICGCSARCADIRQLQAEHTVVLDGPMEQYPGKQCLHQIKRDQEE